MRRIAKRSMVFALAMFAIGACGREASTAVRTATPAKVSSISANPTRGQPPTTDAVSPSADPSARSPAPTTVVISDKLRLERLPDSFEPIVVAHRTVGRFGEAMASQLFGNSIRHGSVIVWIVHGRPATDLLNAPNYAPSTLSVHGLSLFELQNQTTLTSNVLAWSIAPDVVVGVTSRELSKAELLEWIPLIDAQP